MEEKSTAVRDLIATSRPKVPQIVYHYCGPTALLGFLRGQEIWLSSTDYQNDSSERSYAASILWAGAAAVRDGQYGESAPEENKDFARHVVSSVASLETYIACFSEDSDQLSQWRAYAPPSGGYSVGFSVPRLFDLPGRYAFQPCIYDTDQQKRLAEVLWRKHSVLLDPTLTQRDVISNDSGRREEYKALLGDILPATASLKHHKFAEEAEWRLVRPVLEQGVPKYRVTNGQLVPYHAFSLGKDTPRFPIVEIVIGPNQDMDRAERTLNQLLKNFEINECKVSPSKIPFRAW